MSEIDKFVKRREVVKKNAVFNFSKIHKTLKDEIKARGFDYTEKERTIKQLRKGDVYKTVILAERKFDAFVKFHFQIDIIAENVRHGKVDDKLMDMGDFKGIFACWLELDYLNKWNANAITKFLFHIYTKYLIQDKIERYYRVKGAEDFNDLHDRVKELIE